MWINSEVVYNSFCLQIHFLFYCVCVHAQHQYTLPPSSSTLSLLPSCSLTHSLPSSSLSLLPSLSLSHRSLPRLLTVWFDYGYLPEVYETLAGGLKTVDIDTWLQVIPQLIARIDSSCRLVRKLIHDLLTAVGKQHPQVRVEGWYGGGE